MSGVEARLEALINAINSAANQPTVIKFGDRVIDEIKSTINLKNSYNVGIDNSYGRKV